MEQQDASLLAGEQIKLFDPNVSSFVAASVSVSSTVSTTASIAASTTASDSAQQHANNLPPSAYYHYC